jgi:hypothetical protein
MSSQSQSTSRNRCFLICLGAVFTSCLDKIAPAVPPPSHHFTVLPSTISDEFRYDSLPASARSTLEVHFNRVETDTEMVVKASTKTE